MRYIARAVADDPAATEPYQLIEQLRPDVTEPDSPWAYIIASYVRFLDGDMDRAATALGMLTGYQPDVAWTAAPWFTDPRFRAGVTPQGLAGATANIGMYGHVHDDDITRERLRPWFELIDVVCARQPDPQAMAHMAILLRACGRTAESLTLCDRADEVERVMLTEVVRGGTWRKLGDRSQARAAFERALALDPANWSLFLDLADQSAEDGEFAEAAALVSRGLEHEPHEASLRAAGAAYRARATGAAEDLDLLVSLAPDLDPGYRDHLIECAVAGPGLPAELIAGARASQNKI
ncbi:hypothetical protein I4J89_43775 [Actinoplanes sp. NEAU-A11]|uniref:Tetratricopeptide repeat protein n=2 Tax=Actinoplanes aureus TaxID=2792083 RepID=A0A931G4X7_9ACTN|nr:hypothetical protein [Actinoplanes aureus]